jgi:ribonuclease E
MEENRNNATVERRLKEALKNDRARIQIGRISTFGLLEMSRQRLHPSLAEASTEACAHCHGTGRVRSVESTALHVLRMAEEEIARSFSPGVTIFVPTRGRAVHAQPQAPRHRGDGAAARRAGLSAGRR